MKAFPNHRSEGMELRDYFASDAMKTVMANSGGLWSDENLEKYALIAYKQADAMMKAREKKDD
jgi:hypothetical protein